MAVSIHTVNGVKPKSDELTWNPVRFSSFQFLFLFFSCTRKQRQHRSTAILDEISNSHEEFDNICHFHYGPASEARVSDERQVILTETCPELGCVHTKCDFSFFFNLSSWWHSCNGHHRIVAADLCSTLS